MQETLVLRARGSELLILPHHVQKLKGFVKPRDFSQYFRAEALVNRPARKLFEAWLRKDHTLWPRLYQTVHKEMDVTAEGAAADADAPDTAEPAPRKAKSAAETGDAAVERANADKPIAAKADKKDPDHKSEKADKAEAKADKKAKADKTEAKADKTEAKADKTEAKADKKGDKPKVAKVDKKDDKPKASKADKSGKADKKEKAKTDDDKPKAKAAAKKKG